MKILYIAEIVSKTGIYALKKTFPALKKEKRPDFIIACADGATGGNGLGRNHAAYIHKMGINALTLGEYCFYKKDLTENLGKIPYVVRPYNLNIEAPGLGSRVFATEGGKKIATVVLLGQNGFSRLHGSSPFSCLPLLLEKLRKETPYIIVDFHAQATAEKQTLFALANGKCSAVIGSHTRVATADEKILGGGTAVITDVGRTGSMESVGGCDSESRIREYLSGIPDWTRESWEKLELQGVSVEIANNGKAVSIERFRIAVPPPASNEITDKSEKTDDTDD